MDPLLEVSEEVATALAERRPVVALESSLITTDPSAETASLIEKAVRDAGAVPATVCVAGGRLVVGMSDAVIERFTTAKGIPKISARDIGSALAGGGLGATTVAGTIVIAERAGIEVFTTAGIGGVHRRAQESFDISADLLQFTRTRITVVSGGAKSILDPKLTAEYLETAGVPVYGYRTDKLPAFVVREADVPVTRVDDLDVAARAVDFHWEVNGGSTVLLTAPIAAQDALDGDELEQVIARALEEADRAGIVGNAISPYLMKAVAKSTGGGIAKAGRSLLLSTARVAGEFAVSLSAVRAGR
ncbi:pseudouridine-5'-phosphate glycosidase [Streptomyces cellulosae]|jgi:pseudouridine-5'-phosphate glycosidase|uniref:Pseudouridine-5'-phosphate glycosidase n=2 Tax=Streptomyces TaxID=1883 RepID=A0ABU3JC04_9ACTN|nr:pseudouridine-5'-phosphate glycosidase [Streptomyces sp. McG7]MBT2904659.1 pseudouridine-5'-phosphate glycosidase [Streptomyces sp. McG8]MCX4475749.1 pseudouridine-5'-phosphate glycosidase [Streptomyces cellulosae]MDQ0489491.1 pseudouridine-5'-phosphate glycosidase [Streptomyces thermodiastaticus]MDT6972605.1 pseudouridine-5'-phosphate glycosidase [Streptomyces thermocarboxydus]MDX3417621.1 pseudouridine-5'-phosphate glycosidase [Streptomyces sp. MD20-1-1]MXQ59608.1 pseudouridine-5-phospha